MTTLRLPDGVLGMARRGPAWATWVDGCPGSPPTCSRSGSSPSTARRCTASCALVVPVRTVGRRPAVLKVGFPDEESEHEHLALQHWHGRGAVQLLRADPHRWAMLLERLHPEDLTELWDLEACEVVAGLYARLHVPALAAAALAHVVRRPLGRRARRRCRAARRSRADWSSRRSSLARDFVADPASTGTLIHGDLHYENVLAGDREPWLVIDPKPMSGDPHYELAPMLWNRFDELAGDTAERGPPPLPHPGRRRRAGRGPGPRLGGGPEVLNAMWALQDAAREHRGRAPVPASGLTAADRAWVTMCVTIAKAVQD